ncbi:cache domain-containing sensor histidine kinase [Paenibacillus barcinonensis]|uniref:cache domain-containing sensor histidine kinase n=1 Tax=Paenibacillus barcinonensis TaxID=198119 RepID=UPI001FC9F52C|nr:sensor histidine kinase [Paenibacillus barcinonensis]
MRRKLQLKFHWRELILRKPRTLAFKIPFAYFVVILVTVAFSALVLNRISENDAQQKINEASLQTITSIQTNVNLMMENVNNYSKMIFSDPNLQNLLRQGNVYSNLQTQSKVSSYLTNLMQAVPIIDSVYIYDNSGHRFSVGTQQWPAFLEAKVEDASWYEQALKYKGRYLLRLNGGDNDNDDDKIEAEVVPEDSPSHEYTNKETSRSLGNNDQDNEQRDRNHHESNSQNIGSINIQKENGPPAFGTNAEQEKGEEKNNEKEKEKVVSFIRLMRDLDDTSPLGFLVMNIKEKSIAQAYANLPASDSFQVAILDEHQRVIATNAAANVARNTATNTPSTAVASKSTVPPALTSSIQSTSSPASAELFASSASTAAAQKQAGMQEILQANQARLSQAFQEQPTGVVTLHSGGLDYAVTYLSAGEDQWKYISMSPYRATDTRNKSLVLLALMLLGVNGSVFFISSFIISRSVIKPIHKLLRSMQKAPSGNFRKVKVELNSSEFEQLYSGYNQMIEQIEQMLKRIIQEQQTIRRVELNTLQAQIKPHFLYNTLDSITSLAMSGMNDKVCEMLEALGSYYRLSVSKGNEVITLHEEVEIVRHYLTIQQVRYPGIFEVKYDIAPDCERVMMPKLVLQPLVENSLYHGIRAKGSPGIIRIQARQSADAVIVTLTDDGVGMSVEQVQQIQHSEQHNSVWPMPKPPHSSTMIVRDLSHDLHPIDSRNDLTVLNAPFAPENLKKLNFQSNLANCGKDSSSIRTSFASTSAPTSDVNVNASFGLWGTMERLRIFYDREDVMKLESEPGKGTTITITIPRGEGASWNY